jgi:hypothetical protein
MPIKPFRVLPANEAEWARFFKSTEVTPSAASVTPDELGTGSVTEPKLADGAVSTRALQLNAVDNARLRDSNACSVIGRAGNASGDPADILFGLDGQFLVRRAGVVKGDTLIDADIPATIARDTEVTAAVTAHEAASDPHPQYMTQTETDVRYYTKTQTDAAYVLVSNVLSGSATYDPPSLIDGAGTTTTVTVTGAALGDFALASFSLDLQGISVTAYVSAADTVSVRFQNESGGTLDLASGTLKARVWK